MGAGKFSEAPEAAARYACNPRLPKAVAVAGLAASTLVAYLIGHSNRGISLAPIEDLTNEVPVADSDDDQAVGGRS